MSVLVAPPIRDSSENLEKSVRTPAKRKSAKQKHTSKINKEDKFSLHFFCGKSRFTLFLVQYKTPNKTIGSFKYGEPPTDAFVFALLQEYSYHPTSITRAIEKWQDFTATRLPKVIAERERALLHEPRKKVSQNLKGLLAASNVAITDDKNLSSEEDKQMFIDIRKSLWAVQAVVSTGRGWSGAFDVDDVKQALYEVRRGINSMHKRDPKGTNHDHKKLAKYIWQWWESVQPILSNKGNWGITLRVSKEEPPEGSTIPAASGASVGSQDVNSAGHSLPITD